MRSNVITKSRENSNVKRAGKLSDEKKAMMIKLER